MSEVYMICWYYTYRSDDEYPMYYPMYDKVYLYRSVADRVREIMQGHEKDDNVRYFVKPLAVNTVR